MDGWMSTAGKKCRALALYGGGGSGGSCCSDNIRLVGADPTALAFFSFFVFLLAGQPVVARAFCTFRLNDVA